MPGCWWEVTKQEQESAGQMSIRLPFDVYQPYPRIDHRGEPIDFDPYLCDKHGNELSPDIAILGCG